MMDNIVDNWSYDKPFVEGDYLCCYGDVETPDNVHYARFRFDVTGMLVDRESGGRPVSCYGRSYKFARLVYAASEIKLLA